MTYRKALLDWQRQYFTRLLNEHNNNISRVAFVAGVNRQNLYVILKRVGIMVRRAASAEKPAASGKTMFPRNVNRGNAAWQSLR